MADTIGWAWEKVDRPAYERSWHWFYSDDQGRTRGIVRVHPGCSVTAEVYQNEDPADSYNPFDNYTLIGAYDVVEDAKKDIEAWWQTREVAA